MEQAKKRSIGGGRKSEGVPARTRKKLKGSVVLVLADNVVRRRLATLAKGGRTMTQTGLAMEAGLGLNTVLCIEKAQRATNILVVERLAAALGLAPFELLQP